MNKAKLYNCANNMQRRDAKQILDEYAHLMQLDDRESIEDHTLLDIGCGSGDVLVDFVIPLLPAENMKRVVGSDVSEEMVRFARDKYKSRNKLHFDHLDIGSRNIDQFVERHEGFDHVTSFYCLHWVQDQETAMKNIYNLLKPFGNCLLVLIAQMPIFEIYERMGATKKWNKHMHDVDKYISPYQHSEDPAKEFELLLESTGFSEVHVEVKDEVFWFEGIQNLKSEL